MIHREVDPGQTRDSFAGRWTRVGSGGSRSFRDMYRTVATPTPTARSAADVDGTPLGYCATMVTLRHRVRDILAYAACASGGVANAVVRRTGSPHLFELFQSAGSWNTEPAPMLEAAFGIEPTVANAMLDEARATLDDVIGRAKDDDRAYPDYYTVESATALFLHASIRHLRPSVVLETGVADGLSSSIILAAMESNGEGQLHSIDISEDVGLFISDRSRWHLYVIDANHPNACAAVFDKIPTLDIFLHDGNHMPAWQSREYQLAWPKLRSGGLLMSDDIDWSYAFMEFVAEKGLKAPMLMDRRKVFGLVAKP
jgi:predicted O-methyltransferase YrrM